MKTLTTLRWIAGTLVFTCAAVVVGQIASESRTMPVPARVAARLTGAEAPRYSPIAPNDPLALQAVQAAMTDQRRRNGTMGKLLAISAAEHQTAAGENVRLCLSIDRHGRADSARVVVHRSDAVRWSVTLWAWGGCGTTRSQSGQKGKN
jgi:hypothetical protein